MQQHRIISLASILVMLIIPVIGWFLVAQPQLACRGAGRSAARWTPDAQIAASAAVVEQLKADSATLPELDDDSTSCAASIPAGVDPSGLHRRPRVRSRRSRASQITGLTVDEADRVRPGRRLRSTRTLPRRRRRGPESDAGDATLRAAPEPFDPGIVTSPLINSSNFVAIPVTIEVSGKCDRDPAGSSNGLQTEQPPVPGERVQTTHRSRWARA